MNNHRSINPIIAITKRARFLVFCVVIIAVLLVQITTPTVSNAQVAAGAAVAGFGAAFGYAQRIGPFTFTQAGSIGSGAGFGVAVAPGSSASLSAAKSTGPAAAFAQAFGTPFGSSAFVQTAAFFGGSAAAFAAAAP
jgi:hypothetical protein